MDDQLDEEAKVSGENGSAPSVDLFEGKRRALRHALETGLEQAGGQSRGFALMLLFGTQDSPESSNIDLAACAEAARYGGAPDAAFFGFALAMSSEVPDAIAILFSQAVDQIRGRAPRSLESVGQDDVVLLGLAAGLRRLSANMSGVSDERSSWLADLVDEYPNRGVTARIRALAGDLLDGKGRLLKSIDLDDRFALALDVALRRKWPEVYSRVTPPTHAQLVSLASSLLGEPTPFAGALEDISVRLAALDALTTATAAMLIPTVGGVLRLLRRSQGGLKRWTWDQKPRRAGVRAARWLIDSEAHVQALLWAILYPQFGEYLRDEEYLPGYGLKQPRFDFGITILKLIIEVKFARTAGDFREIEEQVAGDLGLYFSEPSRYDRMLVYVYDDSDTPQPERYDSLRHALMQRDGRIEEVVVVRRPGMIPSRNSRDGEATE